jgi:hypothetical protein
MAAINGIAKCASDIRIAVLVAILKDMFIFGRTAVKTDYQHRVFLKEYVFTREKCDTSCYMTLSIDL